MASRPVTSSSSRRQEGCDPVDVRNAISEAHKDGKRSVLMRLKSDDVMKFVAIPIARA